MPRAETAPVLPSPSEPAPAAGDRTTADGPGRRRFGTFERVLLLIVLLACVGRVVYIAALKTESDACGQSLCGDAIFYSGEANVLAHGRGFQEPTLNGRPAADHPPLTAVVLAVTNVPFLWTTSPALPGASGEHAIGPPNMFVQRLTMALIGVAAVWLIGLLGRRLAGDRAGLIAAGLAAINPNFWMNDALPMSESLATLAIVVILLTIYRYRDRPTLGRAAAIAVACGVAMLGRAELGLFLPLTVLPIVLAPRALAGHALSLAARVGRLALIGGIVVAVLLPWFAFNQSRFTEPVLISTNDGLTIVGANCDQVYGVNTEGGVGFWNLNCAFAQDPNVPPGADQSVVARVYRQAGIDYIRNHKRLLPQVETIRLARAWGVFAPDQMVWLNENEGRERWASWLGYVMWWLLIPCAVGGAVVLRRRRVALWPLLSTILIVSITVVAFYGIVRFRLPADVAFVVLAGAGLDALVRRLRHEPAATATAAAPGEAVAP